MEDSLSDIADIIFCMEKEMRRLGLWAREPPRPEALASKQPFCYDTLAFEQWLQWLQWLQWVFIPRMKRILEQGLAVPQDSDVYPLAEEVFSRSSADTRALLDLNRAFDELILSRGSSE